MHCRWSNEDSKLSLSDSSVGQTNCKLSCERF